MLPWIRIFSNFGLKLSKIIYSMITIYCLKLQEIKVCLGNVGKENVEKFEDNVNKIVVVLLLLAKEKTTIF